MNILIRRVYNEKDCVAFGFDERSSIISDKLRKIRSVSRSHYEFSYCWSDNLYVNNIHADNGLVYSEL